MSLYSYQFFFKLGISAERKGDELRKILSQKFSDTFMRMFYDLKISKYIGKYRFEIINQ